MRRLVVLTVVAAVLAGCDGRDPLQIGDPSPAAPATAPLPTVIPVGEVWPVGLGAQAVAVDPGTGLVAVGATGPHRLVILGTDGRPGRILPLPAPASQVIATESGFRAVAGTMLVTVPRSGQPTSVGLPGPAGGLAGLEDGGTVVTLPGRGEVLILAPDGTPRRTVRVGGRPTAVAAAGGRFAVVDPLATSLTTYRIGDGGREQGLRAGNGATAVVADRTGRFVVIDTRDGELLVFSTDPLYLRQRYPAAGAPFGAAYDTARHRLWITLTARNEVVGYDLSAGAPREIARHPTVRQPNGVAVNSTNGTVFVTGSADGVVQVVGS